MRNDGRLFGQLRKVKLEVNCNKFADGSCFVQIGNTHVICIANVDETVPRFLKGTGSGWVTAEYGMLPGSTNSRMQREVTKGKASGRTQEIQRLIGRTLRTAVNLVALKERQIIVDCDVIQADGGTRTASITGAYVALYLALQKLHKQGGVNIFPIKEQVAAISCGIIGGNILLDLDYSEDSLAQVDANFVMTKSKKIVEIQATAERKTFSQEELSQMYALADSGIGELIKKQNEVLNIA
ncbi:ribonuclease PH [Candidatus Bandiella euplotis]|uniref:Ribonuclease PH n=1 Tax=Candidatus Bandiella euplotis TaxID=1664265 RepID=A0ABZ0USN8_9RICK|nr:ribonuclease PH [Candidatus Bandiella woodruffii]WPX97070.1 Ribonuclease PH [Candidatus Bandiella woodruffii]